MRNDYLDYLTHYASEYYDPQEAHEYYMQHRKLKGRSSSKLNEKGKEALAYVKDKITTEKTNKISESKASMESKNKQLLESKTKQLETSKSQMESTIKSHTTQMTSKVEALKNKLQRMTPKQKKMHTAEINAEIAELKDENASMKAQLQSAYKSESTSANEEYKKNVASNKEEHSKNSDKLKLDYENQYYDEYDKLLADPEMTKATTSTTKSSGSVRRVKKKSTTKADNLAKVANYKKLLSKK